MILENKTNTGISKNFLIFICDKSLKINKKAKLGKRNVDFLVQSYNNLATCTLPMESK